MIVDLTYPIHNGMFKYPSDSEPKIEIIPAEITKSVPPAVDNAVRNSYGYAGGYESFIEERYKSGYAELNLRSHHGTHIDAPAHKIPNGKRIDDYPISKFSNECFLIDLTSTDLLERKRREITIKDLGFYFKESLSVSSLILYTGFCDEMKRAEGGLSSGDKISFEEKFPYLSEEATGYILAKNDNLNIVGIDSFAVDKRGSNSEVHRRFFEKDILPLETLVNLDVLRNELFKRNDADALVSTFGGFALYSVPLNYSGGDAAQTRAFAVL